MTAGAIQPGTVVAFGLFLLVGLVIPGLLVWRDIRQERRRLAAPVPPAPTFTAYLSTLSGRLGFVPAQNEEVCAEIEAHLWDTTESLVEEGVDVPDAKRQAMEQLGSPADLAVALRDARRERPRVLATVGGGAIEGGKGLFVGWFYGVLLLVPAMAGLLLLFGLLDSLGFWVSESDARDLVGRWVTLIAVSAGLALGSWRGVIAVSAILRRPVQSVGRPWAIIGGVIVAWLAIFVVGDDFESVAILLRAMLPVAVAVGALRATRPWPRITRRLILRGGAAIFAVFTMAAFVVVPAQAEREWPPLGRNVLPPKAPVSSVPAAADGEEMRLSCSDHRAVVTCQLGPFGSTGAPFSSTWTEVRLEMWRATSDGGWPSGIDPSATAATVWAPAHARSRDVRGSIEIEPRRDGPFWWFVLTGVYTDGVRYRLSDGEGVLLRSEGTIADWLNAPG